MPSGNWSNRSCNRSDAPMVGGRPWQDTRAVLNGILWVCVPERSGASCRGKIHRTRPATAVLSSGCGRSKLERILHVLAEELQARGKLHLEEAFMDASFTGARKRASRLAHQATKFANGASSVAIASSSPVLGNRATFRLVSILTAAANAHLGESEVRNIFRSPYRRPPRDSRSGHKATYCG